MPSPRATWWWRCMYKPHFLIPDTINRNAVEFSMGMQSGHRDYFQGNKAELVQGRRKKVNLKFSHLRFSFITQMTSSHQTAVEVGCHLIHRLVAILDPLLQALCENLPTKG
jgi:hypothetical protein